MPFRYIIIDNQKREHTAKDRAEVSVILGQLLEKFGDKLRIKIQAIPAREKLLNEVSSV